MLYRLKFNTFLGTNKFPGRRKNVKLKKIKLEKDLEIYRHTIENQIDVLLPLEYLKQGSVYGYYNDKNEICGGFTIITKGPFRVLDSIPEFNKLSFDPHLKHTAEITGVWLSKKEQKKYDSLKFWLNLILKVMASKKKYFVYAYSTKKTGLQSIYSRAKPEVLFRGETKILPGMPSPDHESVEVVFRSRIVIQALKNPDFFIKRMVTKKKKNTSHLGKPKSHYEHFENTILPITDSLAGFSGSQSEVNR
jgi:hypothetical protein